MFLKRRESELRLSQAAGDDTAACRLYNAGVFAGRPIIGILGGIGSGKSLIADLFAEFGCLAIHSDKLVEEAYNDPLVRQTLGAWWGESVFLPDGRIDRRAIAARVFSDADQRLRLEGLLFPIVARLRRQTMEAAGKNPAVIAYVWDAPLLLEAGLADQCDARVFVHAPLETRLKRLATARGWSGAELDKREKLQYPLDRKRKLSEYVIDNTADTDYARGQVRELLSRIRGRAVKEAGR